jgi:hypothetical protein
VPYSGCNRVEYLMKLENLYEWLEFIKHNSSRDEFVKVEYLQGEN